MNTVNKQDLLDWLEDEIRPYHKDLAKRILREIQSGRFDSPEMEHENSYWAREGLIKHQQAEIERMRAALEEVENVLGGAYLGPHNAQVKSHLLHVVRQALSTTTEPTGSERVINGLRAWDKELEMFHDKVVAIDFNMGWIKVFSKSEDEFPSNWLPLDSFILHGINSPDKEDTNE